MPRDPHSVPDSTLRLLLAPGIGPRMYHRLHERLGDDESIITAKPSHLRQVEGIGKQRAEQIKAAIDQAEPSRERQAMAERHVELVLSDDADYPPLLRVIPDPPRGLWLRGKLSETDRLAIAIVGSRKCTAYGREQAGRFGALLTQSGLTIVSGGARGIDGEAHRATLRVNGRTIVVFGCGLAKSYPPEHHDLFEKIVEHGSALVSEFPMHTAPRAEHFPRRNRIISGLSLGVLMIEAGQRSGALITGQMAVEDHGREAMALPGRVDSPSSAGCLFALQQGWAAMVLNHADVLTQLDASSQLVRSAVEAAGGRATSESLFDASLTESQQTIIRTLTDNGESMPVDHLAAASGLPLSQIMADLTLLQIRGRIIRDAKGVLLRQR